MVDSTTRPRLMVVALTSIIWVVGGPVLAGAASATVGLGHAGAIFLLVGVAVGLSGALAHSVLLWFSRREFAVSAYALLVVCLSATFGGLLLLALWFRDPSTLSDATLLSWAFGLSATLSMATTYAVVQFLRK